MLRRVIVRCQSRYAVDSKIDLVNKRVQFVFVAMRPFVLQMFVDNVFEGSNDALCKCRFCFTVCGVSVNAFDFTDFLENTFAHGSFIRPYFRWFASDDHRTNIFSNFLRTFSSP